DISDGAVRCSWQTAGWQLTLAVGFRVDQARCKVVRRRRTGRLELHLPQAAPAPVPEHLCSSLSGPGFGWHDGFLAAAEADAVRSRLLELWEGGHLQQGEVEGGVREKVRSDSYLFMEEGDLVISAFTRRLDRLVLGMAKEVPELKGLWLMRGRPMAAVYAGTGSRYAPHFDCVAGDNGRKITCIMPRGRGEGV
ncbi:Egln3, partial [Symbiodinium sp. KB8]